MSRGVLSCGRGFNIHERFSPKNKPPRTAAWRGVPALNILKIISPSSSAKEKKEVSSKRSGFLLRGYFLDVPMDQDVRNSGTRNMLELEIEASYFENKEFTEIASIEPVRILVLSTLVVDP